MQRLREPKLPQGTEIIARVPWHVAPAAHFLRLVILACTALPFAGAALPTAAASNSPADRPLVNVRSFEATGDGSLRPVSEWIKEGRFANLRAIQRKFPFVDNLHWTMDEVAFERAKLALPPDGGTIYFPAGHYVAGRHGWRVWRDNVRMLGDGPDSTILSTAPQVAEGLIISPYRHVGWLEGAAREYPYTSTSGARGGDKLQLIDSQWAAEFAPGELVFIRNGANRFDQDYGEFNEITGVGTDGQLHFKYPLSRDYTLSRFNWAAEVAHDFKIPRAAASVKVQVRTGEGFFVPRVGATVTIGENIFRVSKAAVETLHLANLGRRNAPPGTVIDVGSKIGKSRSVIKVTRTSRNFRCEQLQIVGRRKVLNLSNSYDLTFTDCVFKRDTRAGTFKGGLTIDGDGGRFARFERCTVIAEPPAGMQFARSFGGVLFSDCRFVNANVAFTEFNFDCTVTGSSFEINGTRQLTNVIIAGKSCGDLRFTDNRITAKGVATIFDTYSDIHSQKHGSEGDIVVRDTTIETEEAVRVFTFPEAKHVKLENNRVLRLDK